VAVASPVLRVFADGAEVLVAYRASRSEIVLFALAVVLVVPAALFGLELLTGLRHAIAVDGVVGGWARARPQLLLPGLDLTYGPRGGAGARAPVRLRSPD
jgi:hypothetical protein